MGDTILLVENAAEQIILKVKAESEKAGLQLNTKKFKVIKTAGNCDIKKKIDRISPGFY